VSNDLVHLLSEDRRLILLRILEKAPGCEANHYLLREAISTLGHNVSHDVVLSELSWLAEQGLLTVEVLGSMSIAYLTGRGLDVALGHATVPGVKKPVPGE